MKTQTQISWALGLGILVLFSGCKTTDPLTGKAVYDPVKTAKVHEAVKPIVQTAVSQVIARNTNETAAISGYFRDFGGVFCQMHHLKQFSPEFLAQQIGERLTGAAANLKPETQLWVLTGKNLIVALYGIRFADRNNAEIPPDGYLAFLSKLFCESIDQGLKDAGQQGVPPIVVVPSAGISPELRGLLDARRNRVH